MGVCECRVCRCVVFETGKNKICPQCGRTALRQVPLKGETQILYLRMDQAFKLLRLCESRFELARDPYLRMEALKELLAVRYFMFNGLSPMELANARIEHLDPIDRILFLPRVHWKKNQTKDIDPETVKLQIIYSGDRKKGPLLRSRMTKGHLTEWALWALVKRVALRTSIPGKEFIDPLILKRTFARIFLKTPDNTVLDLQRAFCHKHIWSTGHYLRCVLDDVKVAKTRMMERIKRISEKVVV